MSKHRAILVALQLDGNAHSFDELVQLASGLGFRVVSTHVQHRTSPTPTYVGEGKLRELAALTGGPGELPRGRAPSPPQLRDDLTVIVDDELAPNQARNLELALGVPVLDRTAVILRVFEARARTREAKLEIELARLEYELPRIRDDHALGDREGGGGRASRGHTNVELAKQRGRDRIAALRADLARAETIAERRRLARIEQQRVAIVGYTNAGKSSLMRLLTGSDVLVENKLFATLDTTVRPIVPPIAPPVLVIDTVGFLSRLPHALISSFRSTLAEARDAQLLLHVVDASDPGFRVQRAATDAALAEIGAAAPTWLLLNKIDRVPIAERAALATELPDALPITALDPRHVSLLRGRIATFFAARLVEGRFSLSYAHQGAFAALRDRMQVVAEDYGATMDVTVRAPPAVLDALAALERAGT